MRRLLVTGGAGFIGANFCHYWMEAHPGDRIVVLDALTYAGNRSSLKSLEASGEFRFVLGSIGDTRLVEELLREEQLNTIVHFAAESHVDRSIDGPDAFIETNVVGTHSLLKAARRAWLGNSVVPGHCFYHVSTDEVYGSLEAGDPPFSESTPYAPNSPYSASKAASDHLVRAYHRTYGLKVVTSNCSNNFGPYQLPEKLIPLTILCALHGYRIPVYGDGRNVRDWLFVADHCKGIDLVLSLGTRGRTYNLGGGAEMQNIDVVHAVCDEIDAAFANDGRLADQYPESMARRRVKSASLIEYVRDRPGHDRRYAIDNRRAKTELGFSPCTNFRDALRKTVSWYLTRRWWWEDTWAAVSAGRNRAGTI